MPSKSNSVAQLTASTQTIELWLSNGYYSTNNPFLMLCALRILTLTTWFIIVFLHHVYILYCLKRIEWTLHSAVESFMNLTYEHARNQLTFLILQLKNYWTCITIYRQVEFIALNVDAIFKHIEWIYRYSIFSLKIYSFGRKHVRRILNENIKYVRIMNWKRVDIQLLKHSVMWRYKSIIHIFI